MARFSMSSDGADLIRKDIIIVLQAMIFAFQSGMIALTFPTSQYGRPKKSSKVSRRTCR
jgi:hypothetical protein